MWFKVKKKYYFPHTIHYCCSSMLHLSETSRFLQSSSFWEARPALIGQLSSALWLAEYLKCVTKMLRPLPYCDAVSLCNETKSIKPIINEAFVASSGDMITDYNDLYCLFTCHVVTLHVEGNYILATCLNLSRFAFIWVTFCLFLLSIKTRTKVNRRGQGKEKKII